MGEEHDQRAREYIDEYREFAKDIGADDPAMELPREETYRVMAARPTRKTVPVSPPIRGYYHALYVCDELEEEHGYAGVSFHLEEQ